MARFEACVMGSAVVPWAPDGSLDEALFRHEIASLLAADVRHLSIFDTAGEGYAVDNQQFETVTRVFVDEMRRGQAEPLVGVISVSLPMMLRRIAAARDVLGVRQFQISLPSWGALEAAEVRAFFDTLLGSFPDCQFVHDNLPRAKRVVTAAEYAAIAADHANLVATRNPTDAMGQVRELIEQAPMLRHFLAERGFVYGSLIDQCGLLIGIASTNLGMAQRYFRAGQQRDVDLLVHLEGELSRIQHALTRLVGADGPHIDGAYAKVLWRLHDPRFPLRLLPPYLGADAADADAFAAVLRHEFPQWAP